MGRRVTQSGLTSPRPNSLSLTQDALQGAPVKPKAVAVVVVATGVAFLVGGETRDLVLLALMAENGLLVDSFFPLLVPLLVQAAIGGGVLALLLRGRYPASSMWTIIIAGFVLSGVPGLALLGLSFFHFMVAAAPLVGVLIGVLLRIRGAWWRVGFTCFIGFAFGYAVLAASGLAVNLAGVTPGEVPGLMAHAHNWMHLLHGSLFGKDWGAVYVIATWAAIVHNTFGTAAQDFIFGLSVASGVSWALGPARLWDGTIVRYMPASKFTTEVVRSYSSGLRFNA